MHLPDEFRILIIDFVSSDLFKQVAPLLVLVAVPAAIFFAASAAKESLSLFGSAVMGLESLGSYLPWVWSSPSSSASSSSHNAHSGRAGRKRERKKGRKTVRTRADQVQLNGLTEHHSSGKDEEDEEEEDGYYPGLVNVSGTYCFMNSTLQALSSLSYLQPHIDAIHAKAEALDVPTPVIDALKNLFQDLNTPRSSYHSIRPMDMINVLSKQTEGRTNSLFYSREHQDAQELFQVISECIKNELAAVDKEGLRDRGFGALAQRSDSMKEIGKTVFDGLTANRRSCVICGYTEAVMHFAFDNWQLSLPRLAASCRLEDCLEDYTRLEILKDCICRKCSLVATHNRLKQELATLEEATKPDAKPSKSKKHRLKEVRKFEARVREALAQGRIEDDLKDVRIEKVFSPASTKQAMIARPPPVLALHLNRSIHFGSYASKNNCRVVFPEVLDLTPFTTSGSLSTVPTVSISTPPPAIPRSTTPTPATYGTPRTVYRLSAVVCHFGGHSFGHYICYRRKPRSSALVKEKRFAPPSLVDPLRLEDGAVDDEGGSMELPEYVFEDGQTQPGRGWLRISDDSVGECGIESVLAEGSSVFMLYYERALQPHFGIYPSAARVSEETLKPEVKTVDLNGSVGSLVSEVGVGVLASSSSSVKESQIRVKDKGDLGRSGSGSGSVGFGLGTSQVFEPRIIRSVAAGRGRSSSVQPSSSAASVREASLDPVSSSLHSLPGSSGAALLNGNAHAHRSTPNLVPGSTLSATTGPSTGPVLLAPNAKIPKSPLSVSNLNGTVPIPLSSSSPKSRPHPPETTSTSTSSKTATTSADDDQEPKVHSPKPVHAVPPPPVIDLELEP